MAQRDKQPLRPGAGDARPAEEVLNSVIQELETLHQNVRGQLAEDITRLQTEKTSLIEDIDRLRDQYRQLQSQQVETLSQRYIYQQQLWLKQLAQVLANNLQELLVQRFNELSANSVQGMNLAIPSGEFPTPILVNNYNERATELLASLDASVNRTFDMMDRDLSSYESSLSQRLRNMEGMERQGEALLETLVNRLRVELQEEVDATFDPRDYDSTDTTNSLHPEPSSPPIRKPLPEPTSPPPAPAPAKQPASQVQVGLLLALISAVVLSLFNVSLKIILKAKAPRMIFGLFEVQGVVSPGFGNSLLILLIRLMVVMALMPILATFLYPSVWKDLRRFIDNGDRDLWTKVLGSAFFLFLSQVLIYIAIGNIPTGVAITIFFIYPIVTVLASWGLFGDRPTVLRILAMCVISGGLLLAAVPSFGQKAIGDVGLGVAAAVGAGVTFAGYVLLTQMAAGKLHPIPFSLVNFAAIFVFSAVSLILLPLGIGMGLPTNLAVFVDPNVWSGLLFGGFLLGVLTLFSYLLNNFAIRFAGAALASVIGTLGPALTALFALVIINEKIPFIQVSGLALVTLGVAGMSLERMFMPKKTT
ncbi:EamA family transporter [Kamptonema animale CS-326]|jgi:drug/metabolite transporter (DMT)-like permease|uniref:EamA family transporter n=1 Tax=Kamptonema animale TaxID=92934 RepID=UPI00232D4AD2|nr:EamA family transporter [Kamptonema animale]MDB9513079.1 EamA family transporter [Kamptonema animale CS-326]